MLLCTRRILVFRLIWQQQKPTDTVEIQYSGCVKNIKKSIYTGRVERMYAMDMRNKKTEESGVGVGHFFCCNPQLKLLHPHYNHENNYKECGANQFHQPLLVDTDKSIQSLQ
jgi:hypothetical protein